MAREVIRTFDSLELLGVFVDAAADGGPYDEVAFRENGKPLTGEQMLELARDRARDRPAT